MVALVLSLTLEDQDYDNPPECRFCFRKYRKQQEFCKIDPLEDGSLLFHFADPVHGFKKGGGVEEKRVEKDDLTEFGLDRPAALSVLRSHPIILDLALRDDDVRVTWRRLRAMLTYRFRHPEAKGVQPCKATTSENEKFITQGPPRSVFEWAKPLFLALYALGLSYGEILKPDVIPLVAPNRKGTTTSIGRVVREQKDLELEGLHRLNRHAFHCTWRGLRIIGGEKKRWQMIWEIGVEGRLAPDTQRCLEELCTAHKSFRFETTG